MDDGKAAERCNVGTDCWTMYAKRNVAKAGPNLARSMISGAAAGRSSSVFAARGGHAEDAVFSADCALAQRPHQQYAHER